MKLVFSQVKDVFSWWDVTDCPWWLHLRPRRLACRSQQRVSQNHVWSSCLALAVPCPFSLFHFLCVTFAGCSEEMWSVCVWMYMYMSYFMEKIENQMRTVFSYFHKSSVYGFIQWETRPSTHWTGAQRERPCSAGGVGVTPGPGRPPGGGHSSPPSYSSLENPLEEGMAAPRAIPAWRVSWRRARQPPELFQPGESPGGGHGSPSRYSSLENPHGQRSLVGCGVAESGTRLSY